MTRNAEQGSPVSVEDARQRQAQLLLRAGDLAIQGQDAERAAQAARSHADAIAGDIAALHREIVRLEGWIEGAGANEQPGAGANEQP